MSAFLTTEASDPTMVSLQSQNPHKTQWVAINFNVGAKPEALLAALDAAGWKDLSIPLPIQPLNERLQIELQKPGTGLFNGWTPAEKKARRKELFAILAANGVTEYYEQKLTAMDMF